MIKRNLQKELEEIIKKEEALGNRPRLLLHACCAPCSSYCMEYLDKYFDLTIFFIIPILMMPKNTSLEWKRQEGL